MDPLSKSSPKQKEFLLKLVDEFLEAQKKGMLCKFWVQLYREWFQKWEIIKDTKIMDVAERQKAHGEAVQAKKVYLRHWYQNHTAKQARVLPFRRFAKLALKPKKRKRCLQLTEIYCCLFYKDRIISHIKTEVDRLTILNGCKPTRGMKLCLVHKYAVALYDLEPAEIKSEVEAEYERYKVEIEEDKEAEPTPQSYTEMIDTIAVQFHAFTSMLGTMTGWKFTLLAGGPDPTNGGKIRSFGVHHGKNHTGLSFSEAVPEFKKQITPIFGNYLCTVYTPSECAARALYPVDVDGVGNMVSDTVNEAPAMVAAPLPPLLIDIQATSTSLPVEPTQPALSDNDPTLDPLNENFDALNENIDWDNFEFFDAETLKELSGDGITGSQSGLSLTAELAAPLLDHILQGFAPVLPAMWPPNENASMASIENTLSAHIPLFNPPTNTSTAPDPLPLIMALVVVQAQAQVVLTHELPATPTSEVAASTAVADTPAFASTAAADKAQAVLTHTLLATCTSEAAASTAAADIPPSVAIGTILKSTNGNQQGQNKRGRDPIDPELIVSGKRARKAKERADTNVPVDAGQTTPVKRARKTKGGMATEVSRPRRKENHPPRRSA
ncbi:hypothetical protein BDN71DRAFT_1505825 [Pleurotus eryngii]|uniref:Uncharacterized protein n=1 Tax=Pleurotus eryngii TaxID=5323 RepID=A0A9P6DGP8_PLEER|nr:hypothetical protein BDN71DRAFT_1505825 [Pleurotus eryngii]